MASGNNEDDTQVVGDDTQQAKGDVDNEDPELMKKIDTERDAFEKNREPDNLNDNLQSSENSVERSRTTRYNLRTNPKQKIYTTKISHNIKSKQQHLGTTRSMLKNKAT